MAPPDPIPNSEVKHLRADDSVGSPHVNVGHRQGFIPKSGLYAAFFLIFLFYYSNLISLSDKMAMFVFCLDCF